MKSAGHSIIFEIGDMVAGEGVQAGLPDGRWVRAVPEPFSDGLFARLRSAWEVVCGRAYPVKWPEAGDLEEAMRRKF